MYQTNAIMIETNQEAQKLRWVQLAAMDEDEGHPTFSAVNFGSHIECTDGFRAHRVPNNTGIKGLYAINNNKRIRGHKNQCYRFDGNDLDIYPDIDRVVSKTGLNVIVSRQRMLEIVDRFIDAGTIKLEAIIRDSKAEYLVVKKYTIDSKLHKHAHYTEHYETAQVKLEYDGTVNSRFYIFLDPKYLKDALDMPTEEYNITIGFNGTKEPCNVTSGDMLAVIMPMDVCEKTISDFEAGKGDR